MTAQTSQLAVSLDVSAIPQLRNAEKAGLLLQIATTHEHSLLPRARGRLATPLHNVKYTLNCHAHSCTRRLFA